MNGSASILHSDDTSESDQLAAAVLRALGRSHRDHFSLSPARVGILGWLSFGLVPLFKLNRQFRDAVKLERQQLWHLAEWSHTRTGSNEAAALADAAKEIHYRDGLAMFAKLAVLSFVLIAFVMLQDRFGLSSLLDATYRFRRSQFSAERYVTVFFAWNLGIGVAYALHWWQIHRHARRVQRFAERFDALARTEGVEPLPRTQQCGEFEIGWFIPAVLLSWTGAFWAIPMMIAAAAQRRYVNVTGQQLRVSLLERVHGMLILRRPAGTVPNMAIHGQRCSNALCRAPLRPNASFCTRCGAGATAMSEVA